MFVKLHEAWVYLNISMPNGGTVTSSADYCRVIITQGPNYRPISCYQATNLLNIHTDLKRINTQTHHETKVFYSSRSSVILRHPPPSVPLASISALILRSSRVSYLPQVFNATVIKQVSQNLISINAPKPDSSIQLFWLVFTVAVVASSPQVGCSIPAPTAPPRGGNTSRVSVERRSRNTSHFWVEGRITDAFSGRIPAF